MHDPDPRDDRIPIGPLDCASVEGMSCLGTFGLDRIQLVGEPSEHLQDGDFARVLEMAPRDVRGLV